MPEVNKSLTIQEVEDKRGAMNIAIAGAIQVFESETGMRVGYIDTVRKSDKDDDEGCCCIKPYSEDRGDVVSVNANMNMDY